MLLDSAGRLIALSGLLLAAGCASPEAGREIPRISPKEAHDRAEAHQALLVCPYDQVECPGTHVVGTISFEEFTARRSGLPRNQDIILYCGCPREATAAARAADLQEAGFNHVEVINGGLLAWILAGYEVTTTPKERKP
ncbi:MAG TPA: rhodanese-like domain-containing protein [Planctomycetota bacterium]|nr:rhodanese-like domain-containing protein [Planctomycetota bacterium]